MTTMMTTTTTATATTEKKLYKEMTMREGKMPEIRMEWDWREKFVELYQNVDLHAYVSHIYVYILCRTRERTHKRTERGGRIREKERFRDRQKKYEHSRADRIHAYTHTHVHIYYIYKHISIRILELLLPSTRSFCMVCTMLALNWFYFIFVSFFSWHREETSSENRIATYIL